MFNSTNFEPEIDARHCDQVELFDSLKDSSIDLVASDFPYGMNFVSNHRAVKYDKIHSDSNLDWLPLCVKNMKRVCKQDAHLYIFCSWHNIDIFKREISKEFKVKNILIWLKNNTGMGDLEGDYAPQYEFVIFCTNGNKKLNGGRDSCILPARITGNVHHPTEKPVPLMSYFIEKSSKVGDTVLDPFAGSFTTAIPCIELKRNFKGSEISETHYKTGIKRIETAKQKVTLHSGLFL